ncbi:MAG: 6-phosphogluconate dehydrogenase [Saprospiraceae bacterium]|nr:6-phosphogluconate dehydrogenase [Saprospiraceae bacterium]
MDINTEGIKTKARSIFRKFMWILLTGAILFSAGYYFYRTYTLSEGTRSGVLFKISKKGKVFKTYEGQLMLAGSAILTKASTWDFSVKDAATYSQLQMLEGKHVRLYYKELVDAFPWQGDTDYLVYKAEEIDGE